MLKSRTVSGYLTSPVTSTLYNMIQICRVPVEPFHFMLIISFLMLVHNFYLQRLVDFFFGKTTNVFLQ